MIKKTGKKVAKSKPKAIATVKSATPADLLQIAVKQDADIDKMKQLMDMQERWEAKEAKKAYVLAMSNFRANCPMIERTKEGHQSKFAGLAETIEQIKSLMADNGLSHSWKMDQDKEGQLITVTCCVTHVFGHTECTSLSAGPDDSGNKIAIQAMASTISYLERYTLFGLLGLASAEMDDDGQAAGGSQKQEYITEQQAADLRALMEEIGVEEEKFLKVFKLESLDGIYAEKYDDAVKRIESKRKKGNE